MHECGLQSALAIQDGIAFNKAAVVTDEPRRYILDGLVSGVFQRTFPDGGYPPVHGLECFHMTRITCHILSELGGPKLGVRCRGGGVSAAYVSMPKTTVYEYDGVISRKDNIRAARQLPNMKSVTEPHRKKTSPQCPLRLRILAANAGHHAAALAGGQDRLSVRCLVSVPTDDIKGADARRMV